MGPDVRPRIGYVDEAAGRLSVSGRAAASSARSMPYRAISPAAFSVNASASAWVTPSPSAMVSSLRTRSSSVPGGSDFSTR